jgi:amino acid adenylation domain-containing protein
MQQTSEAFRVSPQQERIWLLGSNSEKSSYVSACVATIHGLTDVRRFKDALVSVAERHEILRTTVQRKTTSLTPVQVIHARPTVSLMEHDLRNLDQHSQRIEELMSGAIADCTQTAAGLQTHLARCADDRYVVVVAIASIFADGDSLVKIVDEALSDQASGAPQYADVAEALQQLRRSQHAQTGARYWQSKNALPAVPNSLSKEFQFDENEPFKASSVGIAITSETLNAAEQLATSVEVPVDAVFAATWALLLSRLTGQTEVTLGNLYSGRTQDELQTAVGLLARFAPLRIRSTRNASFRELVKTIFRETNEGDLYQDYFEWNEPSQNSAEPLFPFCFESYDVRLNKAVNGISAQIEELESHIDEFKIKLQVTRRADDVALHLHYDVRRFKREAIAAWSERYSVLLHSAVARPDAFCGELNCLSERERKAVTEEPNRTAAEYQKQRCLHQLVEHQAARMVSAPAVRCEGEELTYAQLNARANQLARVLQEYGAGAESIVSVCLPRCLQLPVAILGILKAGAAYLPLDAGNPTDRIRFVLKESSAALVISLEQYRTLFPEEMRVLYLDKDEELICSQSTKPFSTSCNPEQLAYVIYTSGSTGRPKGVMITHRNAVNYLSWCAKAYSVAARPATIVSSSIGFDLTVTSLWSALVSGTTAILLTGNYPIEQVGAQLQGDKRFSLLKITPAELNILSHTLPKEDLNDRVGAVVIGGEALYGESLEFFRQHAPETRLINEYGPTETTVGCSIYEIPADDELWGPVPIGLPIANTRVFVMDENINPLPLGVTGELYVGGDGVGRGYCRRSELTAERFVPDPVSGLAGARLYKTGDLGRWNEAGQLEYAGRNDDQVKIRGYRIELGEIEAELRRRPEVRDAAVAVHGDGEDKRLIAYIVSTKGRSQSATGIQEIRTHLQLSLPDYMVPSAFVQLEEFPLTAHGKVDRKALPAYQASSSVAEPGNGLPQTEMEKKIALAWREVLGMDTVRVNDNFFSLGGHSLLMFQVHWKLKEIVSPDVQILDLFTYPTVASMAQHLSGSAKVQEESFTLEERSNRKKELFQQRRMTVAARRNE